MRCDAAQVPIPASFPHIEGSGRPLDKFRPDRRYAIVAEADLKEAGAKLAALGDGGQVSQATT
jgi:hypothetical protein